MKNLITKNITKKALIFSSLLACQPVNAQTLEQAMEQAIQTNPEVLTVAYGRLASDHVIDQAKSGYFPKVDLTAGYGIEWSENSSTQPGGNKLTRRELGLALVQMIYDGGAIKSSVLRSEHLANAAAFGVAGISEQIGLLAAKSYLDVLRFKALLELTDANVQSHQKVFDRIALRAKSQTSPKADIEQARARLALANANVQAAMGNYLDSKTAFLKVVGEMPEGLELPSSDKCCGVVPQTLKEALSIAFEKHPELKAMAENYEAALAQEKVADANMSAKVNLELGASYNRNIDGVKDDNEGQSAMIRMDYNVYNGGADVARLKETVHLTKKEKDFAFNSKLQIEESVRLAFDAFETITVQMPHLERHAIAATKSHKAYESQFFVGRRSLLDLLDAENEILTSHRSLINGQFDEQFACYRLLASMGVLVDTMGVKVREESKLTE